MANAKKIIQDRSVDPNEGPGIVKDKHPFCTTKDQPGPLKSVEERSPSKGALHKTATKGIKDRVTFSLETEKSVSKALDTGEIPLAVKDERPKMKAAKTDSKAKTVER